MGKSKLKKTFARTDCAATEEDFEEAMVKAMEASLQAAAATGKDDKVPDTTCKEGRVRDDAAVSAARGDDERAQGRRGAALAGGGRSRSRSRVRSPGAARAGDRASSRGTQRHPPEPLSGSTARRRGRGGSSRSRSPHRQPSPHRSESRRNRGCVPSPPRGAPQGAARQSTPVSKNGQQKAKDAMAKEKEKALLKKQQREKDQRERLAMKEKGKALQQQELDSDIANASALAVISAKPAEDSASKVAALATPETEQAAIAAAAAADAEAAAALAARRASAVSVPGERSSRDGANSAKQLDATLVKKLFQLLDRSEKNAVSKRDVLIGLRKHAPVRVLFGLPAGSTGDGGDELQARINAIQDAFEASSGLGELSATFDELSKVGDGSGQSFVWDSFLAHCQQEAVRVRAAEALLLLPREHSVGASFEATYEWKVVLDGAACAAGLEYKMDMATGRTLGRLPRPKGWK